MRDTLQGIHNRPEDEEARQREADWGGHQTRRVCGWRNEGVAGKEGRLAEKEEEEGEEGWQCVQQH